jgi:hypothetical protein
MGVLSAGAAYLILSGVWDALDNWQERRFMQSDWRERWR